MARGFAPLAATSEARTGWPRFGGAGSETSSTSITSPAAVSNAGPRSARIESRAASAFRSGAKRWLRSATARSGTTFTFAVDPPSAHTAWSDSSVLAAVEHGPAVVELADAPSGAPRRWTTFFPIHGRAAWAGEPRISTMIRIEPWQPASTTAPVGSSKSAASATSRSGARRLEGGEARVAPLDLLPAVKDEGEVVDRLGELGGERD